MMKIGCAVDEIKSLTPSEIKAILDRDKAGEFLFLDVRDILSFSGWQKLLHNKVIKEGVK